MSNQIQQSTVFNFNQNLVRTIADEKGEYWFLANDVCTILGYINPRRTVSLHCKEKGVTKRYTPTESGNQEMIYINEPNLYRLIIKSRKPEAEAFEEWVMEEVLPTIRKTGSYELTGSLKKTTTAERKGLREAVNALSKKSGVHYSKIYKMIHQRFDVSHIDDLSDLQVKEAMEYVHRLMFSDNRPVLTEEAFKLFAKMLSYSEEYAKYRDAVLKGKDEGIQNQLIKATNTSGEGILFVFKSDILSDIARAKTIVVDMAQGLIAV